MNGSPIIPAFDVHAVSQAADGIVPLITPYFRCYSVSGLTSGRGFASCFHGVFSRINCWAILQSGCGCNVLRPLALISLLKALILVAVYYIFGLDSVWVTSRLCVAVMSSFVKWLRRGWCWCRCTWFKLNSASVGVSGSSTRSVSGV